MRLPALQSRLLIITFTAVLAACGTNPYSLPKVESGEPAYEESSPQRVPEKPRESTSPSTPEASTAHNSLISKAEEARDRGDYDQALAYLERAQRIDPDSATIYLAMAQTHDEAGNPSQARATAERGLLYCSGSSQCNALRAYTR